MTITLALWAGSPGTQGSSRPPRTWPASRRPCWMADHRCSVKKARHFHETGTLSRGDNSHARLGHPEPNFAGGKIFFSGVFRPRRIYGYLVVDRRGAPDFDNLAHE